MNVAPPLSPPLSASSGSQPASTSLLVLETIPLCFTALARPSHEAIPDLLAYGLRSNHRWKNSIVEALSARNRREGVWCDRPRALSGSPVCCFSHWLWPHGSDAHSTSPSPPIWLCYVAVLISSLRVCVCVCVFACVCVRLHVCWHVCWYVYMCVMVSVCWYM
jgi:hypothetical protein